MALEELKRESTADPVYITLNLPLRGQVPSMAQKGHVQIVKLKQRCQDLVCWPGIDREQEVSLQDYASCLLSGKTGAPALPPL